MGTNSNANRKAEKAYEVYAQKVGEVLVASDRRFESLDEDGIEIRALRIRFTDSEHGDYFCTVRAYVDGEAMVGFHGGDTFQDVLIGALNRMYNRTMKWRPDEYG